MTSPNHGDRRGQAVTLVVLHGTWMADGAAARARLCDPAAGVSAHWLVHEDGRTEALVAEDRRAWHAGAGAWRGADDVNSRSIGIELVNTGDAPFAHPQMTALESLLGAVLARHGLSPAAVIAHSDMAPGRKADPGPRFDWARLARAGLARAAPPAAPPPGAGAGTGAGTGAGADRPLAASLDAIGYPPADPSARLAAFRLRWRPHAAGPETAADRALAAALAALDPAAPPGHIPSARTAG